MDGKLHEQIAFYLTGRRDGSSLQPMDGRYRPALFTHYADLSSLRYDFPLVLNHEGPAERAVLSLSGLVDNAIDALVDNPDRDRIARHGHRLEHELRRELTANGPGDFATLWNAVTDRLAGENEAVHDSAGRLWKEFRVKGELVDADRALPTSVVRHAWSLVQARKATEFRQRAERLLHKLRDILAAEVIGSAVGRAPERLKAGVGASFAGTFDFDVMSRILVKAKPGVGLSEQRRKRINGLIDVLERQRFYPLGIDGPEPYGFAFDHCSHALEAYQTRHDEAVELLKALAIAELETNGDYRDSMHNVLFDGFGANGLEVAELAKLPDYLVCAKSEELDPTESNQIVQLLAAGLPIRVLVQTDDILEPSAIAEGHVTLGLGSRQFVKTAIGLTDVFVFQSSASQLFINRDSLLRGLTYDGPALFSVFSGANGHTGNFPAYLVAAAATESRVFPSLVYDPSAGSDWAGRLRVDDNPMKYDEWPVHAFAYEDEHLQARSEELAFTPADFMALDDRFFRHFAIVKKADWSDGMTPTPEVLQADVDGLPEEVPYITLVDDAGRLQRAVLDDRTLSEVRRWRMMWHSLQELGGIHNSHAERLLALGRKAQASVAVPSPAAEVRVAMPTTAETAEVLLPELVIEESHGDDPFIETARCTTCNECTGVNSKMFAYDENRQAYIADPDAGTFRQLVEAAETCQVSIIHPGKPRNPKEPGLEDLIRRATEFN